MCKNSWTKSTKYRLVYLHKHKGLQLLNSMSAHIMSLTGCTTITLKYQMDKFLTKTHQTCQGSRNKLFSGILALAWTPVVPPYEPYGM